MSYGIYPNSTPEFRLYKNEDGIQVMQVRYINNLMGYCGKWKDVDSVVETKTQINKEQETLREMFNSNLSFLYNTKEHKKRITICNSCDKLKIIPIVRVKKCGVCNCIVSAKTKLLNEKCPENKW